MTSRAALRQQLTAQREIAAGQVAALSRDLDAITSAQDFAATDDEHDPEGATIAFERQHVAALLDQAREQLTQIDAAMRKLAEGSYGRCERCGQDIGAARLAARPVAATCMSCASRR